MILKISILDEPVLEFGRGRHQCPKFGISQYDVYDINEPTRRSQIIVGAIGDGETLELLEVWIERCREKISPKSKNDSNPYLFPGFCGFDQHTGFRARMEISGRTHRQISSKETRDLLAISNRAERIEKAIELYHEHARFLIQNRNVDVVVCTLPTSIYEAIGPRKHGLPSDEEKLPYEDGDAEEEEETEALELDFRRALKARCMYLGRPLQLIRQNSLSPKRSVQDDATKAWNFCTAMYYKASNTVPWKMSSVTDEPVCYVGVSFYRTRDRQALNTSIAQVFDEWGQGVILRGSPAAIDKDNRRPYLSEENAQKLLLDALSEYHSAMEHQPRRVVIHKTSPFRQEEVIGFETALDSFSVSRRDFLSIRTSSVTVLRRGDYPPSRGTQLALDDTRTLLYTRGYVPFYRTYPGGYVPRPIELTFAAVDTSQSLLTQEVLALSKMNWNNAQLDGKYPVTVGCARRVGDVMKYLGDDQLPRVNYGFYM